ncbi:methyltransferase domain-containing protein [Nocardia sp. ET3-3]|uniref:Methyltransferase domain-containing protein n=1 Tax=Nocardia terrae TaxID=2675851 RepID=A0A7K1UT60_9NOCA|nr:class I SAM-dependent methyltransferase [Nocardia terrae]MVU77534.1 methyltransferase domain-containing protein [Nocardia terrae]
MTGTEREINQYFESVYRSQPTDGSVIAAAGWDLSEPQPLVVELEAVGAIRGEILDAGCGTGENALYLAARGHRVTGIDAAPTALAHARAKAARRGLAAEFAEADARDLSVYRARFDTVIDSGLLHTFSGRDAADYIAALHLACRPGAAVHIMAVGDTAPAGPGPRRMTETDLRESFTAGWDIEVLRRSVMRGALPGGPAADIPAWLLTARRH